MDQYYYVDARNQQAGPYSLNDLVAQGITSSTLVWKQGMSGWVPAAQVPEVAVALQRGPVSGGGSGRASSGRRQAGRHAGLGHPQHGLWLSAPRSVCHCLCREVACRRGAGRDGDGPPAVQALIDFHNNCSGHRHSGQYHLLLCHDGRLIRPEAARGNRAEWPHSASRGGTKLPGTASGRRLPPYKPRRIVRPVRHESITNNSTIWKPIIM